MPPMTMKDLLTPDRVIPLLRARDKRAVLRKLAGVISREVGLCEHAVTKAVIPCAEAPAFGPGHGVALPHALVHGLEKPVAAFARLRPAVDFGAVDGSATDLVTLLLSPRIGAASHLRALACIARRLRERLVREHLRAATNRDAMYLVLAGEEGESPFAPARAGSAGATWASAS